MITKFTLPAERINISVQSCGQGAIRDLFDMLEGLEQAIELTEQESVTIDLNARLIVLHFTDRDGTARQWRERIRGNDRNAIVQALVEGSDSKREALTEDIIRLRARRDQKLPQAWQYKAQPLVKRLIALSGHEPAIFLKACGLRPGKIQNLPVKPSGEVSRTIKLKTFVSLSGEMKESALLATYIPLGQGAYLNWVGGLNPHYNIQLQQPLPEIVQQSLTGSLAADLVDDPRAKAMLGPMTVTGFGNFSNGHQILLSAEDDELMEDVPDWVEHHHLRLNNRLFDWASAQDAPQRKAA